MKITLHTNHSGQLMVYVPKKDLEEEVITQTWQDNACIVSLANGWELEIPGVTNPIATPQTVNAKVLSN